VAVEQVKHRRLRSRHSGVPRYRGAALPGRGTQGWDRRGKTRHVLSVVGGVGLTFAAYISASFGLLVVVPPDQAGTLSSGATALALVFGSFAGKSIAVRVYRTAMSPLAACAELERCAGSQFDPDVVAAFLKVLDMQEFMEPSSNLAT
jgi:hypothetical protein